MKVSLQSKVGRQRRELARLLDENETLSLTLAVESSRALFYQSLAEDGGKVLKLIRQKLDVPGHEHLFNDSRACVLCLKTESRIALDARIAERKAAKK
jgi:hypothetical protein